MIKEKTKKVKKGKKTEGDELESENPTIFFDIFKQLKSQFYKENGGKSTLESLKESLGGNVLKDLAFTYQKLNKKSPETIIKTLREFYGFLENQNEDYFTSLMASWVIIHEKLLTTEFEKEIFAWVLRIDEQIIRKNRTAAKKNFKVFYPSWYLMQQESNEEIKQLALDNLSLLVPEPEKHPHAFFVAHENFIHLITSWILQDAKQFKEINLFLDDDDCSRAHSRLLNLAFRGLSHGLRILNGHEDKDEFHDRLLKMLQFDQNENAIINLFNNMKKDFSLRSEIANFYNELIREGVETFESKPSLLIIKNFQNNADAKEPLLQQVFWEKGLMNTILQGMSDKTDVTHMKKFYKKVQGILEVGGLGIGLVFFQQVNRFLLASPLLQLDNHTASKNFNTALAENSKQIIELMKTYLNCLELEICKFYTGKLVEAYFELSAAILSDVVLKTRALINQGKLYNDKDLTEPLKKNIESSFDKLVEALILHPLEQFIEKNSPEYMNELMVGMNNSKFIPKCYAKFIRVLNSKENAAVLEANNDILKRALNKLAASLDNISSNKKKFENFLLMIDILAKEGIDSEPSEETVMTKSIKGLFKNSSQFLEKFSTENIDIDTIEETYSKEAFGNFYKYLSNILLSESNLNQEICRGLIPDLSSKVSQVILDILGDFFELFQDQQKKWEILQFLFKIFYTIQDWKERTKIFSVDEVEPIFKAILTHFQEVESIEESLMTSKADQYFVVLLALSPTINVSFLEQSKKLKDAELKEFCVNWAETNKKNSQKFDQFFSSRSFEQLTTGIVDKFMFGRTRVCLIYYDLFLRFSKRVKTEKIISNYGRIFRKENDKDEYLRYKLVPLEERIRSMTSEQVHQISGDLFLFLNHSRNFSVDKTICKLEEILINLHQNAKVRLVCALNDHIRGYFGAKGSLVSACTQSNVESLITILGFYLDKLIFDDYLKEPTAEELLVTVLDEHLYTNSLNQITVWKYIKTVVLNCKKVADFGAICKSQLLQKQNTLSHLSLLASPLCLQIVLGYDLKKFNTDVGSENILPHLTEMRSSCPEVFYAFLKESFTLSFTSDAQFIYALKRILLSISGDELVDECEKQELFMFCVDQLTNHSKNCSEQLSKLIEISHFVFSYFNKSLFNLSFMKEFRTKLYERVKTAFGSSEETEIQETPSNTYKELDTLQSVFDYNMYICSCRGSGTTGMSVFKNVMFDLQSDEAFKGLSKEVSLALLFKSLNLAIEDGEFIKFSDKIETIEEKFQEGLSLSSFGAQKSLLLVSLLEFLRKVIRVIEIFSKKFEANIHQEILNIAISKVKELNEIKNREEQDFSKYGCGFDDLLVEIAETLSRFCISFSKNLNENDLYVLLNCSVPVIQKSALIVLRYYYDNLVVAINVESEEEEAQDKFFRSHEKYIKEPFSILREVVKLDQQISPGKNLKKKQVKRTSEILAIREASRDGDLKLFSYGLTWIAFMERLKCRRLEGSTEQNYYERQLLNEQELYSCFLNVLFDWVAELKLPGKEFEKKLEKMTIHEMPLYWTDYINQTTILELLLFSFYRFSSNFPKFLRAWVQSADKKYAALASSVVKVKISDLIFDYEIEQINNKEPSNSFVK
jgi:hypothetical protein